MASDLNDRLAALSPAKRALLELKTGRKCPKTAVANDIPRTSRTGFVPLSFCQERLWFLDRLDPGSTVYSIPNRMRFRGNLDAEILRRCLEEIVRRHEILRTHYAMADGKPAQVIDPPPRFELPVVNLSALPESEREREAARLCELEARRPFDLSGDLMLRACLYRLGDDDHILFLNRHHIASDGWSLGVLRSELETLYPAFATGGPSSSPLPVLPIQYADFAVWQRDRMQGAELEQQLDYWRGQLEGVPQLLRLPTDHPRPAEQSYRGGMIPCGVSESLTLALQELSRREGVTLFMTLLAAFQTLLLRLTDSDQVLVGSVIAGRTRKETEAMLGFFVNTLVFRGDLAGDPSFRELLQRTRSTATGAYAHQDLPFERLVQELRPERALSHSPIFQVMFVLQSAPPEIDLPGLRGTPSERIDNGTSDVDLAISFDDHGSSLKGYVQYSTDLFERPTIERLFGHYVTLLEGIVADPGQNLSALPLLTAAQRHQLLVEWNPPASSLREESSCVHKLFEERTAANPEAVCIIHGKQHLTCREVNERANRLAHYIVKQIKAPEAKIGLCIDRSPEMVVAVLAILKANAAYVPLDPSQPADRLAFIIRDTGIPLLITAGSAWKAPPDQGLAVIDLHAHRNEIDREPPDNPAPVANTRNLAYVIHTSGSTGRPKGVMIEHAALAHYLRSAVDCYGLTARDRLLQFASLTFDASAEEIFAPLITGAAMVLRTEDMLDSMERFLTACDEWRLTVVSLPTAFWHELVKWLSACNGALPRTIRVMIIGGERAFPERVAEWKRLHPGVRLINSYGPTEITVAATVWELPCKGACAIAGEVPIGKPLPHAKALILDRNGRLLPVGVPGELHIGGKSLARGYLNHPELTEQSFIANPFEPAERLYKTGDLARHLPGGDIEYLGRIDDQVKIRGFRIEPGEIENVLRKEPCVRDAAVVVRDDAPGGKRIVAYVVPHKETDAADLRAFLKRQLPDYMLPSAFVLLPLLPLTPGGKVDRRALPAPDSETPGDDFIAPRDDLEKQLAAIWEKYLARRPIGIRDNFFELGGHSLLAVSVFSEIERKLGRNLPLATLFHAPTIAQLATALRDHGWKTPWSPLVPVKPEGANPPLFFVHGADGGILHYRPLIGHMGDEQPCYGLQSPGLDGSPIAQGSAGDFAELYITAVRTVQPHGPYLLSGFSSGGIIAFEMAQQLRAMGEDVALLVLFDTGNPRIRPRRYTFKERCAMRRGEIAGLPPHRAFWYLFKRFRGMVLARISKKREDIQKLFYKRELKTGTSISYQHRHLHVRQVNHKIHDDYQPAPYPGKLTIIRADSVEKGCEYDEYLGWQGLADKGIEIVRFPALHGELFKEPCVGPVAEALTRCIREALAANAGASMPRPDASAPH